jgi:hypothetical protein
MISHKYKRHLMSLSFIICLLSFSVALLSCDHIAEGDELIRVKQEPAQRVVLLEDFTGQRCVNCPLGSEVIEQLQEAYGDHVVAVGIHGGPLGFKGNAKNVGLATDLGDEYYNHWNLEYQPVGLVDRHGAVNYSDWAKAVKEELAKTAAVDLKASATLKDGTINMVVEATGKDGTVSGKLQVWVLEDGITAMQMMPDGSTNREYVHNHVFRTAVNGSWGEDMTIHEAETRKQTYTQAVDASWNTANLSIVAFVYNNNGVEQAVKGKVNSEK